MTSILTGIPINNPNVKALDLSALKAFKVSEADEEIYKFFIQAQEKMLESRHTQHDSTSQNPTYKPYATIEVDGKVVAKINNHGGVETSNALGGKIQKLFENEGNGLKGPRLAQERAAKIADLFGGEVVKSSTAQTQAQFIATPQPQSHIDYQAIKEDPIYDQLQKTKQARTLFLTQKIAQEDEVKTASNDAVKEFLDYMDLTPEERYYEAILAEKGLTKEQLAALPPEERVKIEEAIKEEIRKRIEAKLTEDPKKDDA